MSRPDDFDQAGPMCFAVDMHDTSRRTSHILCHRPRGHDGDHGNERFAWPKLVSERTYNDGIAEERRRWNELRKAAEWLADFHDDPDADRAVRAALAELFPADVLS